MVEDKDAQIKALQEENLRLRDSLSTLSAMALETALRTKQLVNEIAQSNERIKEILSERQSTTGDSNTSI